MQEIAPQVYIETNFPGVTLGAINGHHGLILVDTPLRSEDIRSWRSALLNLGGGVDRLLVIMDTHFDRTLGANEMDCTVVGHINAIDVFRNRPNTFKMQTAETGAEWELYPSSTIIRWAAPEISFTEQMEINWNNQPVLLDYRPGPSSAAIWLHLAAQQVLFLGDAVMPDQPPFLENADLPVWIENLKGLLKPKYQNYLLVSGRCGLITQDAVREQIKILEWLSAGIEKLTRHTAPVEQIRRLAETYLEKNPAPKDRSALYLRRLNYGLQYYYSRHFLPPVDEPDQVS